MTGDRILRSRLCAECQQKLYHLDNPKVNEIMADAILKFQPDSVFISNGSPGSLSQTILSRSGENLTLILGRE